jgi:DNA-binding MarR family transcriptional regulator
MIRNDLDPLILDLLEWLAREPRSYADVIDAWRTSCPRLTVWEDAIDRGFAVREHATTGREVMIRLTTAGRAFLREHGRIDTPSVARMERSEIRGGSSTM